MLWHNDSMFYSFQFSFWYLFFGSILTYLVWGFVISFEVVLAMSGSSFALRWIKRHHTYKQLYYEVKVFYPMIYLGYFFLEQLPYLIWKTPKIDFDMEGLFEALYGEGK